MIVIVEHAEGCLVAVRAQPGARRRGVVGELAGALKVAVNAAPEQGKANKAVVDVLCEAFGLKKSQVELVSGAASREKKFLLRGVSAAAAQARCRELTGQDQSS